MLGKKGKGGPTKTLLSPGSFLQCGDLQTGDTEGGDTGQAACMSQEVMCTALKYRL